MSAFDKVAPYYDELMRSVPYRMWAGYYLLLLAAQDVQPRTVLDVCCGTGNVAEVLHKEGYELAGLDISPPMIARARAKAARKRLQIDYWVADAADFHLNRRFEAAFSFFDSLNNITDPGRLESAFRCVAEHLPVGGSWVFDLNTAYAFEARMFDQQNLSSHVRLRYKWEGEWDAESRLITVRMRFFRGDEEFEEIHRQRAYGQDEVWSMLERAGFTDIRSYHGYSLERPNKKSDRIHYSALKA